METKEIEVTCPCCSTRLSIDVRTSSVLKATAPQNVDETGKAVVDESRWDDASEHVETRTDRGGNEFEAALEKEKSRERDLDDLFEKARNKVRKHQEGDEGSR